MNISNELLKKYGLLTYEEYVEQWVEVSDENAKKRAFCEMFLNATDHIPLKIFENFIESMATASLAESFVVVIRFFKDVKVTYADVLSARKTVRDEINKLEQGVS